jgi:quercetin dioxygenase-like cupin family protein
MGLVVLTDDQENIVAGHYSSGKGPVLRSDRIEFTKIAYEKGEGAAFHSHLEEQVLYLLSGRVRINLDGDQYEVGPGEATYHPSNVPHSLEVIEDTVALSFKNLVDPSYESTGQL